MSGRLRRSNSCDRAWLFIPRANPYGAGPSIRDRLGERNWLTIGDRVHIDAADHVAVSTEAARGIAADPFSPFGLSLAPAAYRTPAGGSPLRSGEALDVALCAFVIQIFNVFAILPLGHTLTVMPASWTPAHSIGIADVDNSDTLLYTKVHDPPDTLVS